MLMWRYVQSLLKNLPVRFPFHKYLGPGNNIESGSAVDIDDLIALQHDIDYLVSRTDEDIFRADRKAIAEFYQLFITELNFEALCGWVGLTLKHHIEQKIGVIYPSMSSTTKKSGKTTHQGHKLYAQRMKFLATEYQKEKLQGSKQTWHDYLRKAGAKPSTTDPTNQIAGPSGLQSTSKKPSTLSSAFDETLDSPQSMDFANDDTVVENPMEIEGLREGTAAGIGSHTFNAKGTMSHTRIPRSLRLKSFHMNFGKSRIFYSYAYAFRTIIEKKTNAATKADIGDQVYYTTSLAMLPNDLLAFYMNSYEWGLMAQYGLFKVKKCNVTVVPQGLRTAFDTGTTLSATATSEHCAIGVFNIGINQKYYCKYMGYNSSSDSPMIPTSLKDISIDDMLKKYYGDIDQKENGPMCLGVPRHVDHYMIPVTNSRREVPHYPIHSNGPPLLDKFLDRFNFGSHVGDKIIDWEYIPQFGYINVKQHEIPYNVADSDTVFGNNAFAHATQKISVTCQKEGVTAIKLSNNSEIHSTEDIARETVGYYSIDGNKVFAPFDNRGTKGMHKVIPLIHIGLLPTPALNPATDNTNFLNACAYWSVKSDIVLEYNLESSFGHSAFSPAHAYNDEVIFLPARDKINYGLIQPLALESYGN